MRITIVSLCVVVCLACAAPLLAVDPNRAPTKPATDAGDKNADPNKSADPNKAPAHADEAERQKILNSREWHETQREFHEWLSVQKTYTPDEVKKMKAQLAARVDRMSAPELQDFMEDSEDKLKVLMSQQAEDARLYLAQRMAVEVNLTPEQIRKLRPDVINMTAAQLQQRLQELQLERQQTRSAQQAFDQGRQTQVKNIEAMERQAEKEREQALDRAYYDLNSPYGSYYGNNNRAANNQLRNGPSSFVNSGFGLSFGLGGGTAVTYGYRF